MKEIGKNTAGDPTTIQCVEVLISERFINKIQDNLSWTLSVYSLENKPVKKDRTTQDSEVFHFMVYDWNRTIKQLLADQQIPYSVIGYFSLENIFNSDTEDAYADTAMLA